MAKEIVYHYDPTSDELNVAFGQNKRAIGIELENEVFLQVDPRTSEIVSFSVPHFSKRTTPAASKRVAVPFRGQLIAENVAI